MTFHEAACYQDEGKVPAGEDLQAWRKKELANIRWNTLKVLRQLSKCGLSEDRHKIMQLTAVRAPLMQFGYGQTAVSEEDQPIEGSSNLFYYLFEDYSAAVGILITSKLALQTLVSSSSGEHAPFIPSRGRAALLTSSRARASWPRR